MDPKKPKKKRPADVELLEQPRHLSAAPASPAFASNELEEELRATKEHLVSTISALQSSNQDLTVSNEEAVALNEELQTVVAELEATKERQQEFNEELGKVNERLEEKLAELETTNNDLVNLLNCTEIATIFLDRKLRIRRLTQAANKVANLIAADVGRPLAQFALKIPDAALIPDCQRVLREFSPCQKDIVTEDGRWWLRRISLYVTINHRVEGVVVTFNDITDVKHADQKARLLAAVLMESSDAIIVHDFQGRISTWNRGAERLYGYSEAEALQMNIDQLVPEASREKLHARWRSLARSGSAQTWEAQRIARSGQAIDVWITLTALADDRGRSMAIAKIDRDITELTKARKRLEEDIEHRTSDLAEQQKRLRAILDSASDAIVTIDQAGKIESVNRAAERIFGYAADEMIGQNVTTLMRVPYCDPNDARCGEAGQKSTIGMVHEVEARRKDGTIIPIELTVSEVEHLNLYTCLIRDVSQRKNLEREVMEIALLEQRRIGQDLHDECGQQLTALALLADSLVDSLDQKLPAEAESAGKIEHGLKTVLRHVRNMSHGLVWEEVRPETLAAALAELVGRLREITTVRCTLDIAEDVQVRDALEATQIYHIAQEACTNALKHAQADVVAVRLFSIDEALVLEVCDDGVGMPVNYREGLGLRIMRNRASVMKAKLALEAVKPHGTRVTCACPKRIADSSHQAEPDHEQ